MFKKAFRIVFLTLFFLFLTINCALAESNIKGKVIVFCLDGIDSQTLFSTSFPNLRFLLDKGAIGLMSNQGYRGADSFRGYLTLGTGNRAPFSSYAVQSYEVEEKGYPFSPSDVYQLQNGKKPGRAQIVHLGLNLLNKAFEEPLYNVRAGALGEELHRNGLKTAVIGNSDLGFLPDSLTTYRFAPVVAMDNDGLVDRGAISKEVLKTDPGFPYGVRIDNQKILSRFKSFYSQTDFIVIEYGDTFRLNKYKDFLSEERKQFLLSQVLNRADWLVGELLKQIDFKKDFFILVVPSTEGIEESLNPLSPIVIYGPGYSRGLLLSATTHQEGFVSNTDFAPTVLNFFGLNKSSYFLGNHIFSRKTFSPGERVRFLLERDQRALVINSLRKPLIVFFASLQVIFYFLTFLVIMARKRKSFRNFLTWGFLFFLSLPLSLQVWPLLVGDWSSPFLPLILLVLFFSLLFVRLYTWSGDKDYAYLGLTIFTFLWLVYDLLTGSKQSLDSVFGYSSILGARFFGLGNEEMAIMLSVFLLSLAFLLEKSEKLSNQKIWVMIAVVVFFFLIGWPALGADFGGTVTSFIALSLFLLWIFEVKISFRQILIICLAGFLLISSFIVYDLSRPLENQTHLARTISLVKEEGLSSLLLTIERKAETNWRVFRSSPWSYFFLLIFVFLVVLFFRPVGWLKNFFARKPFLRSAFYSSLWAGVIGFALNDSGIVIPALILSYFLPYLFLSLLEQTDGVKV